MACHVALLGSINVGGNRLKMADLKAALSVAGFVEVETVAASGNVLFSTGVGSASDAETKIRDTIRRAFGIDSLVAVRTPAELRSAIELNPFHGDGEDRFVHSIFLEKQPASARFDALLEEHKAKGSERLALGDRVLFLDYIHGVGVSSLTGPFLQRRLECRGTARNMTSLKRILARLD